MRGGWIVKVTLDFKHQGCGCFSKHVSSPTVYILAMLRAAERKVLESRIALALGHKPATTSPMAIGAAIEGREAKATAINGEKATGIIMEPNCNKLGAAQEYCAHCLVISWIIL